MRWQCVVFTSRALLPLPGISVSHARTLHASTSISQSRADGGGDGAKGPNDRNRGIVVSSTMYQTGTGFDELPVAFQKTSGCDELLKKLESVRQRAVTKKTSEEIAEIVDGFRRCSTIRDLLRLLATVPSEDVTPLVAAHILDKLIELENNTQFRNDGYSSDKLFSHQPENFTRSAVAGTLVEKIISGSDASLILYALKAFHKDYCVNPEINAEFVVRLSNELMYRAIRCDLSFQTAGELALHFYHMKDVWATGLAEKLWLCIVDKAHEIKTGSQLVLLFQVLPVMKQSRGTLLRVAQEKTGELFFELVPHEVVAICSCLSTIRDYPIRLLETLSRWMEVHLHLIKEHELISIVSALNEARYLDQSVKNSLNRYMKSCLEKISDPEVVATLARYCVKVKFRSPAMLDRIGDYFVVNSRDNLSPVQIKAVMEAFGILAYTPARSFELFGALELVLNARFVQFKPGDALDVLLACIYIQRYPLNFVKKVFNPFFLDRVHTSAPYEIVSARRKLKLLDTALCLECPQYRGPMLPRDVSAKSSAVDGRLKRLSESLFDPVTKLVMEWEPEATVDTSVYLPTLPLVELYRIDFFVRHRIREKNVAIFVHLPEDYVEDKSSLLGPQLMRHKHLRLHGYQTIGWDYEILTRLVSKEDELVKFITDSLKKCSE